MNLVAFLYCVTVFTASPTLKPEPDTGVPTAEMSSTSVNVITPTCELMRRMTWPVEGSLTSRVTRSTVSWSPFSQAGLGADVQNHLTAIDRSDQALH